MNTLIRSAYLRVYLPDKEGRWEQHTPAGRGFIVVGDYGLVDESLRNDALYVEWEGSRYVCPRYPRLRMLEGLLTFRATYPGLTGDLLIPESVADRAGSEIDSLRTTNPDLQSHIIASPWHVPLRWFAAFDPSEREVVERGDHLSIRYRSALADAIGRLQRSVQLLERAGFHESVIEPVSDLTEWLARFADDAMVELDYGEVAELFSDGELAVDETAADIAASLTALEEDDLDVAGDRYGMAAARWASAQALTFMN